MPSVRPISTARFGERPRKRPSPTSSGSTSRSSSSSSTTVVTNDEAAWRVAAELEVDVRAGVPRGQGAAVEAALARLEPIGPVAVVNADLPCVQPDDLRALLEAVPPAGIAAAPAADGT